MMLIIVLLLMLCECCNERVSVGIASHMVSEYIIQRDIGLSDIYFEVISNPAPEFMEQGKFIDRYTVP